MQKKVVQVWKRAYMTREGRGQWTSGADQGTQPLVKPTIVKCGSWNPRTVG
jgi:hypothetical protein